MKVNPKQLKQQVDLLRVVGRYTALRACGAKYKKGNCPFCKGKNTFAVTKQKQVYKCFKCGKYGDVLNFAQDFLQLNFVEFHQQEFR